MPAAKGRKRSLGSVTSNASAKRRKSSAKDSATAFTRDFSPSKNVHFPSNLISGPYVSDPQRRSQSPVRSSLRDRMDAYDSPYAQLELEQRQAQCELSLPKRGAKSKGKSPVKPARGRSGRQVTVDDELSEDESSSPYVDEDGLYLMKPGESLRKILTAKGKSSAKPQNGKPSRKAADEVVLDEFFDDDGYESPYYDEDGDAVVSPPRSGRKIATSKGKSPAKPKTAKPSRKATNEVRPGAISDDDGPDSPSYGEDGEGPEYASDTENGPARAPRSMNFTGSNKDHDHVCTVMDELRGQVKAFAESFPANRTSDALQSLLKWEHKQLVRYIGCLAIGGKDGVEGWRTLLSDKTCRHALVSGIIGRCLKEHVFDELCFGADPKLTDILSKKEQEQAGNDGFFRTTHRADTIMKYEKRYLTDFALQKAVASVTLQLEHLLLPLWQQGSTSANWKKSKKRDELAAIVEIAGQLSQTMRKDRDTIYYWPPTFKDEEFEPERMEGMDLAGMIRNSPYETKKTKKGHDRAVIMEGHEHRGTALVRIVCFPGVMSFQQGGGELAKHELAKENGELDHAPPDVQRQRKLIARSSRQGELTGDEGFRTRVISKAVVLLQWGTQRLLTKEAGTSKHFEAKKAGSNKYAKDYEGFVELYDLFMDEMERGEDEQPQSWLPNVSRLFSRSPSLAPVEDRGPG